MKLWSDTLSTADLMRAAHGVCRVADISVIPNPRTRLNGWKVYLEGSSYYASQATGGKAATWDEWGVWMARLFELDPDARIGPYDGRDDFIAQTRERIEAQETYIEQYGGRRHPGMSAPWLDHTKAPA